MTRWLLLSATTYIIAFGTSELTGSCPIHVGAFTQLLSMRRAKCASPTPSSCNTYCCMSAKLTRTLTPSFPGEGGDGPGECLGGVGGSWGCPWGESWGGHARNLGRVLGIILGRTLGMAMQIRQKTIPSFPTSPHANLTANKNSKPDQTTPRRKPFSQ